jgi:hypothetical protein
MPVASEVNVRALVVVARLARETAWGQPTGARLAAEFEGEVDLSSPCFAPIVFVAIPGTAGAADRWLAVTGR